MNWVEEVFWENIGCIPFVGTGVSAFHGDFDDKSWKARSAILAEDAAKTAILVSLLSPQAKHMLGTLKMRALGFGTGRYGWRAPIAWQIGAGFAIGAYAGTKISGHFWGKEGAADAKRFYSGLTRWDTLGPTVKDWWDTVSDPSLIGAGWNTTFGQKVRSATKANPSGQRIGIANQ